MAEHHGAPAPPPPALPPHYVHVRTHPHRPHVHRRIAYAALAVAALVIVLIAVLLETAPHALQQHPSAPVPLGTSATVGGLTLTVHQAALVQEAGTGPTVLSVEVTVTNASTYPIIVDMGDFAAVQPDGTLERPLAAAALAHPFISSLIGPGRSASGAIAFALHGAHPTLLDFSSDNLPSAGRSFSLGNPA